MTIVRSNVENELQLPESRSAADGFRKFGTVLLCILCTVIAAGGTWWFLTVNWGATAWANLTMEEFMFTLTMPLSGTNSDMVYEHIRVCVVPALIVAAFVIIVFVLLRKRKPLFHASQAVFAVAGIFLAGFASTKFWTVLDLSGYMSARSEYSSFIDENYVDPNNAELAFPEKKRNLIYIFLESMENTYADQSVGGAFEESRIPELAQLSLENENFSGDDTTLNGGHAMTGATFTMGGMFAQTSGLPIMLPVNGNNLNQQEDFYPSLTALGDILEEQGYKQVYILGSDAIFGGRKHYFKMHGNFDIQDYYYYLEQGVVKKEEYVWWGYDDEQLFENARNELEELSASDEPFNLMLLTVDTHMEDGYVCELCRDEFDDQYSNVLACSSRQVTEFVRWCQEQPFYENTTIILSGDHLTMDGDYCDFIPSDYDRTVYATVINSAVENTSNKRRAFTTFDMFPTTLAALGVEIPGNRLGLGVNLYSDEKTLYEIYGPSLMNEGLSAKSELIEHFAEGLITETTTFSDTYFDEETETIHLIIRNMTIPEDMTALTAACWANEDGSDMVWYQLEKVDEKTYQCLIPMSDFAYAPGTYRINAYTDTEIRHTYIGSHYISYGKGQQQENPGEEETAPQLYVTPVDYANCSVHMTVSRIPDDIVQLNVAIWCSEDQSDVRWYEFLRDENGDYVMDISLLDFGIVNTTYNIHVYGVYPSGDNRIFLAEERNIG